jgi:hypothetical protein
MSVSGLIQRPVVGESESGPRLRWRVKAGAGMLEEYPQDEVVRRKG